MGDMFRMRRAGVVNNCQIFQCHEEYETKCATSYENKCSTVTEVTTKYEQVCATSYVESCAVVTEVIRECHTASLPAVPAYGHSYGHGHGHLYGHYTAPINECVEVPVHNKVCTKEPVESCDQVAKEVPVAREVCTKEPVQSCSKVPRKVCRNVAVSVPRNVARRVCYGGKKGRY